MSTAELALRILLNEWSKTKIVVTAEDVGRQGEDGKIRLDEAIVTLKSPGMPLYIVGGKTVMPFGVFEDHLIEGTLTEDLYEIDEWGATLGFNPDFYGMDISFSVYRNPQVINNLEEFDTHDVSPGRQKEDKFRSFITNVTLEPIEDTLTLSAFYNSEPGDGNRNQSIGGAYPGGHGLAGMGRREAQIRGSGNFLRAQQYRWRSGHSCSDRRGSLERA